MGDWFRGLGARSVKNKPDAGSPREAKAAAAVAARTPEPQPPPSRMTPEETGPVKHLMYEIYESARSDGSGHLADYIPQLALVEPDQYGMAIATVAGDIFSVGDAKAPFTIQSVSKAITYCLALEAIGRDEVVKRVGVEPSGDAFNAIELSPTTRRPYNPMVNAGAMTVAGILYEQWGDQAFDRVLQAFSKAAGRPLSLNEAVYRSEAETGHRNRAIAHLLLSVGALHAPVEPVLDLYFRQCSINVTAIDMAWIGATMANLGKHPITGEIVFDFRAVRDTQAVMFTCGMYDYSGNWAYDVGLPAKSGVGGGIMGVINRQLGIGTFSPRLDLNGNSVRGIASFRRLSEELGLHAFEMTNTGSAFVEAMFKIRR